MAGAGGSINRFVCFRTGARGVLFLWHLFVFSRKQRVSLGGCVGQGKCEEGDLKSLLPHLLPVTQ